MGKKTVPINDAKCLQCDASAMSRGLCAAHYAAFGRQKRLLNDADAQKYDDELVTAGMILPKQQGRRNDLEPDIFAQYAAKYRSVTNHELMNRAANSKRKKNED